MKTEIRKLKFFVVLSLCLSIMPRTTAQDEYEQRVYDIYKNFQSQDITDEMWETQFNELREDVYEIQVGDNLWDISKIFFGDGFYWSKLWSVNDKITNPHEIEPGSVIRFIRGSEDAPPTISTEKKSQNLLWSKNESSLNVALLPDSEDTTEEQMDYSAQVATKDPIYLLPGAPSLPKAKKPTKPVLKRFPRSLHSKEITNIQFDGSGFSFEGFPELPKEAFVTLSSYIVDEWPETSGHLIENEGDNLVAPDLTYTYLEMSEKADVGEVFTVIRKADHLNFAEGEEKVVLVLGQVKLTEALPEGENRFRAQVVKSIAPIMKSDLLLRTPLPIATLSNEGQPKQLSTKIMGGMADDKQKFFTEGAVVYLDKGKEDGVNSDDLLAVSAARRSRNENPEVAEKPVYSGLIKVVQTGAHRSTALVVQATDELRVGDETGVTVKSRDVTTSENLSDVVNDEDSKAVE